MPMHDDTLITYDILLVPLGKVNIDDVNNTVTFPINVVVRMDLKGKITRGNLIELVKKHPLKSLKTKNVKINSKIIGEINYTGALKIDEMLSNLKSYLGINNDQAFALNEFENEDLSGKDLPQDTRFDEFDSRQIVDGIQLYNYSIPIRNFLASYAIDIIANSKKSFFLKSNSTVTRLKPNAIRFINSLAVETLLDSIPINARDAKLIYKSLGMPIHKFNELVFEISGTRMFDTDSREAINSFLSTGATVDKWEEFQKRVFGESDGIVPFAADAQESTVIGEADLQKRLMKRDPKILLITALKDQVFSKKLGFITQWEVTMPNLGLNNFSLSINDLRNLQIISSTDRQNYGIYNTPTECEIFKNSFIYPATRTRANSPKHTGLVLLNESVNSNESSRPRYQTAHVNVDHEIIKGVILQKANTRNTVLDKIDHTKIKSNENLATITPEETILSDQTAQNNTSEKKDLPNELLTDHLANLNEPTTSGIAFYAPPEDIACNACVKKGENYHLEDLWIGYRIDIKEKDSHHHLSLHEQVVDIKDEKSGLTFCHEYNESYIEREQLQDDKKPATDFAVWTGIGNAQRNPVGITRTGGKIERIKKIKRDGSIEYIKPTIEDVENNRTEKVSFDVQFEKIIKAQSQSLPKLKYKTEYNYRLRTVFTGGISLSKDDADFLLSQLGSDYVQDFGFYRVESYAAGEIVDPSYIPNKEGKGQDNEQVIYITEESKSKKIYLAPTALNFNQTRFHNLLGKSENEIDKYKHRAISNNLRKLLIENKQLRWREYFCDPDIYSVEVTSSSLARNPDIPPSTPKFFDIKRGKQEEIERTLCEVVQHWEFGLNTLHYGKPYRWEKYRPLTFEFKSKKLDKPEARTEYHSKRPNKYKLWLSPGDVIDVSILPKVSSRQTKESAIYQSVKKYLVTLTATTSEDPTPIFPTISERKIRVIHATKKPLISPFFKFDPRYLIRQSKNKNDAENIYSMPRKVEGNSGYIVGWMGVDSKTTGLTCFDVRWNDILDNVNQPKPIFSEGSYTTPTRSILFSEKPLPLNKAARTLEYDEYLKSKKDILESIGCQCLEDVVHFEDVGEFDQAPDKTEEGKSPSINEIKFVDGRRRRATAIVKAKSRYREQYPPGDDSEFEVYSEKILLDVPNTLKPSLPKISHILPTFKRSKRVDKEGRTHLEEEMGLRIYLDRPFFETGVGERIAIACAYKKDNSSQEYAKLKKYSTMWGEDPLERPKLKVTKREPKAEDFTVPEDIGDEDLIDLKFYPDSDPLESERVLYASVNHLIEMEEEVEKEQVVSEQQVLPLNLASFAVEYDKEQALWFTNVLVKGEFFGWLGLALYRHQPHSINDDKKLSAEPVFSYAAILQGDPIVYFEKDGWFHINIGPVYDKSLSYTLVFADIIDTGIYYSKHKNVEFKLNESTKMFHLVLRNKSNQKLLIQKSKNFMPIGSLLL